MNNEEKKRKLRHFFKEKKAWLIGTGTFLLVGIVALVIGFGFAWGWDTIAKWFYSPAAITLYVLLGVFVLIFIRVLVWAKRYEE